MGRVELVCTEVHSNQSSVLAVFLFAITTFIQAIAFDQQALCLKRVQAALTSF